MKYKIILNSDPLLLVQALRALKQENVTDNELQTINSLKRRITDKTVKIKSNYTQYLLMPYGLSRVSFVINCNTPMIALFFRYGHQICKAIDHHGGLGNDTDDNAHDVHSCAYKPI